MTNIARGTTDPGYWVYNLNHVSDWNWFEIILAEKVYSSYGLNTLGPLCLWQCFLVTSHNMNLQMEFVLLTNYTRILHFRFCSYCHHGVVLTMFALNIHVLSFGHPQTTEVAGQQCWWWWTFTTITASGIYQMQAVDGGCRWNAGGGNECSRNKQFISKVRYIYKLTQRPKI